MNAPPIPVRTEDAIMSRTDGAATVTWGGGERNVTVSVILNGHGRNI